ncbi:MAG: lytic murein transglycosylase [Nocardioides sp.]
MNSARPQANGEGSGGRARDRRDTTQPSAVWPISRELRERATRLGIPAEALQAYTRAAWSVPDCQIGWATLAAVGQVESDHGRMDGDALGRDGRPSRDIIGPRLDGRGNYAAIPATSYGTSLHGDNKWEHALGPMQFLPETWQRWGADGDGDGVKNPQDLDDAAMASAAYLCASGVSLYDGSTWERAVLSYNKSDDYLRKVFDMAVHYAAFG